MSTSSSKTLLKYFSHIINFTYLLMGLNLKAFFLSRVRQPIHMNMCVNLKIYSQQSFFQLDMYFPVLVRS